MLERILSAFRSADFPTRRARVRPRVGVVGLGQAACPSVLTDLDQMSPNGVLEPAQSAHWARKEARAARLVSRQPVWGALGLGRVCEI